MSTPVSYCTPSNEPNIIQRLIASNEACLRYKPAAVTKTGSGKRFQTTRCHRRLQSIHLLPTEVHQMSQAARLTRGHVQPSVSVVVCGRLSQTGYQVMLNPEPPSQYVYCYILINYLEFKCLLIDKKIIQIFFKLWLKTPHAFCGLNWLLQQYNQHDQKWLEKKVWNLWCHKPKKGFFIRECLFRILILR